MHSAPLDAVCLCAIHPPRPVPSGRDFPALRASQHPVRLRCSSKLAIWLFSIGWTPTLHTGKSRPLARRGTTEPRLRPGGLHLFKVLGNFDRSPGGVSSALGGLRYSRFSKAVAWKIRTGQRALGSTSVLLHPWGWRCALPAAWAAFESTDSWTEPANSTLSLAL